MRNRDKRVTLFLSEQEHKTATEIAARYNLNVSSMFRLMLSGQIDMSKAIAPITESKPADPNAVLPGMRSMTARGLEAKAADLIDHGHRVSAGLFWDGFTPKERQAVEARAAELRRQQEPGTVVSPQPENIIMTADGPLDLSDWEE